MTKLAWVFLFLALGIVFSCADPGRDWSEAQKKDNAESYEEFLKKHPKSTQAIAARKKISEKYIAKGIELYNQGKLNDSIDNFERLIEIDSDNAEAHYFLGKLYNIIPLHMDKSKEELERAIALNPNLELAHAALADIYFKVEGSSLGKRKEAINHLEKAIEINPKRAKTYEQLGSVYAFTEGKSEDGIIKLNKALLINPKSGKAHYYLAYIYYNKRQFPAAIMHYDKSKELNYEGGTIGFKGLRWEDDLDKLRKEYTKQ